MFVVVLVLSIALLWCVLFFFQAEDGIRDLVRSRGLGDVYKRQVQGNDVIKTIDELATQGRIQMVAVVHRQMGFWKRLFHGSTAKRMTLHTSLPMLVLPERPR